MANPDNEHCAECGDGIDIDHANIYCQGCMEKLDKKVRGEEKAIEQRGIEKGIDMTLTRKPSLEAEIVRSGKIFARAKDVWYKTGYKKGRQAGIAAVLEKLHEICIRDIMKAGATKEDAEQQYKDWLEIEPQFQEAIAAANTASFKKEAVAQESKKCWCGGNIEEHDNAAKAAREEKVK